MRLTGRAAIMKQRLILTLALLIGLVPTVRGFQDSGEIRRMEAAGDVAGARAALARAAQTRPNDAGALANYAEFLERYGDPGARDAYRMLLAVLGGNSARAGAVARRLAYLDLLAGDREAAGRDLESYSSATGKRLALGTRESARKGPVVSIPGPLRSFARMAAIPSDVRPPDVLEALARNVVTQGYEASRSKEAMEPTEYLKLVHRYLSQARELQAVAGDQNVIRIEKCDSPGVADLLRILGYRMRGGCGSEVVLETVNAARAFLTTDSGFPISQLEQALRTDHPFAYDYAATSVPALFGPEYWTAGWNSKDNPDFIDAFISDPTMCRLYLGLAKLDDETASALRTAIPYARLRIYAHVWDFFGGMFEIRGGKAITPGGPRSAAAWTEMVGVSPDQGPQFLDRLVGKDDGWMASFFDALARIRGPVYDYLTEPARLKRFYAAVRGAVTSPGPARPVFRANADMMLLTTRLQFDADGKPHLPGGLGVWRTLFVEHPQGKYDVKLTHLAATWKEPDDVLEGLFALCRKAVENQPLKIFLAISDIDRGRAVPLDPASVERLARAYRDYASQFPIFSESPSLTGQTMVAYLDTAEAIARIRDPLLHSDTAGAYQGLVELWQILVRQQSIPSARADAVLADLAAGFAQIHNDRELFDAGRKGAETLASSASGGPAGSAAGMEKRIVDLLAGASETADADAREHAALEIDRILEAQRVVSIDALFQLADYFSAAASGEKPPAAAVNKLASSINEIQLPRPPLTTVERNMLSFGFWPERHIEAQRGLNLRAALEKAAGDPEKIRDLRGLLAPLLRDTLVAFAYAYYAPPGAQMLFTNPLFVRSHDFRGPSADLTWRPTEFFGAGWPSNGGGRLTGSLAGLPYALASAEQNFLVPAQTQALIWGDLAPQLLLSAKVARWWTVTPSQLHWVGLQDRYGRELLAQAALDPEKRAPVIEALAPLVAPGRSRQVEQLLAEGDVQRAIELVAPSELLLLAGDFASQQTADDSPLLAEIRSLAATVPTEVSSAAISRAFGTPKPILANSYRPELLNLRTFPTLMGYSSRILAESWESSNIYWAALADELGLPPAQLNVRIPEWTEKVVERIFASNLDDWPAVLRSLRQVGDEERSRGAAAAAAEQKASLEGFSNR
jgi:hypothetical protein